MLDPADLLARARGTNNPGIAHRLAGQAIAHASNRPGGHRKPKGRLVGFGSATPVGAGASTLTRSQVTKPLHKGGFLFIGDNAGIVLSIDSITVDGVNVYIDTSFPAASLRDTNLNRYRFKLPPVQRSIVIVATVSAAGTWTAGAEDAIPEGVNDDCDDDD